jgi:hypothetical protein
LREFTTTEKDMKKNRSKHPTPDYRILSEDMIEIEAKKEGSGISNTSEHEIKHIPMQKSSTHISTATDDFEGQTFER